MRRAVAIAALCGSLTFVIAACASASDDEPADRGEPRRPVAGAPAARSAAAGVRLSRVGTFDMPTYLAAPPGDRTRRFVVERAGRIVLLHGGHRTTFLDIRPRVSTDGEGGLLSMAFPPDYARSRRYYAYYVERGSGAIAIVQFRATPDGNRTRAGSGRTVLRQAHHQLNHKGGQLQFGHDGMLYTGFGDGGGGGDPDRNAQNLSRLLGKILRIDPEPGGGYRIPSDNPFVGRRGARAEVFAYGLRNPFRFSFDRRTGDLAIGDVGQDAVEEVDFLRASRQAKRPRGGVNFGWPAFEGRSRYYASERAPGHVSPVIQRFHRSGSCSLIGGYVVRDRSLPALRGRYVYGDLCDGRLRWARLGPHGTRGGGLLGLGVSQLASFGEDARGRVYAISLSGGVYRLAPRGR